MRPFLSKKNVTSFRYYLSRYIRVEAHLTDTTMKYLFAAIQLAENAENSYTVGPRQLMSDLLHKFSVLVE
jgi:hypothetical protein